MGSVFTMKMITLHGELEGNSVIAKGTGTIIGPIRGDTTPMAPREEEGEEDEKNTHIFSDRTGTTQLWMPAGELSWANAASPPPAPADLSRLFRLEWSRMVLWGLFQQ